MAIISQMMKSIMKNNGNLAPTEKYRYALITLLLVLAFFLAACQKTAWYKETLDCEELAKYDESTQTIAFIDTGISKELEEDFNIIDKYRCGNNVVRKGMSNRVMYRKEGK